VERSLGSQRWNPRSTESFPGSGADFRDGVGCNVWCMAEQLKIAQDRSITERCWRIKATPSKACNQRALRGALGGLASLEAA
jgi:hypothetical protein